MSIIQEIIQAWKLNGVELNPGASPEELEALREAKYREIRDAELDFRTGKLSLATNSSFIFQQGGQQNAKVLTVIHQPDVDCLIATDRSR